MIAHILIKGKCSHPLRHNNLFVFCKRLRKVVKISTFGGFYFRMRFSVACGLVLLMLTIFTVVQTKPGCGECPKCDKVNCLVSPCQGWVCLDPPSSQCR